VSNSDFTGEAEGVDDAAGLPTAAGVADDAVPEFGFAGAEFSIDLHPAPKIMSKKMTAYDFINACGYSQLRGRSRTTSAVAVSR
jgi:hypothetical protein